MPKIPSRYGWKWENRRRWLYLGLGGDIYAFHLEIGRFSVSWESTKRWSKTQRR